MIYIVILAMPIAIDFKYHHVQREVYRVYSIVLHQQNFCRM